MLTKLLLFAALCGDATMAYAPSSISRHSPAPSATARYAKKKASFEKLDDLKFDKVEAGELAFDKDIDKAGKTPIVFKRAKIERTWEGARDGSEMKLDVIVPPTGKPKGVVCFMHGFSQYPMAYRNTLKDISERAGIAIVAVETGLTSSQVLSDTISRVGNPQYVLQRAVAKDTLQCMQMIKNGEAPFNEFPQSARSKLGVFGHSMGGGLTPYVASKVKRVEYMAGMAPFFKVEPEFTPEDALMEGNVPLHSMFLSGSWDLIARPSRIREVSAFVNSEKTESSIYADIDKGVHTGFQDTIVLFNARLTVYSWKFFFLQFIGAFEVLLVYLIQKCLSDQGQRDLMRSFWVYFFTCMVNGTNPSPATAMSFLENDKSLKSKWIERIDTIDYPEKKGPTATVASKAPGRVVYD